LSPERREPQPSDHLSTHELLEDLGGRSARSGVLRVGAQGLQVSILIASGMVLARLLTPGAFGVFAMVLTLVGFVESFRDFGLPFAAVHREDLAEHEVGALFWLSLKLSVWTTVFVVIMAPVLSIFYREERLLAVTLVMAVGVLALGLSTVHEGLLIRQMRFGALTTIEVIALLVGVVAALSAAAFGAGYWALVIQYVVRGVVKSAATWMACAWRPPRRAGSAGTAAIRPLIRYGRELTVSRVIQYFGYNMDRILAGYAFGAGSLGLYDNAFRWSRYPVRQLFGPLRNVAVSGLTRVRDDRERYRNAFRRGTLPIYTLVMPVLAFMVVEAPGVILVLLGDQWLDAVPLFRVLAASAFAASIQLSTSWVYLSEGRTARQLRWVIIQALVMITAVAIGVGWGILGVAVAFATGVWLLVTPGVAFCARGSQLRARDFLAVTWRPALASIVAGLLLFTLSPMLPAAAPPGVLEETAALRSLAVRLPVLVGIYAAIWWTLPGGRAASHQLWSLVAALRTDKARSGTGLADGTGDDPGSEA
jgi:PST family polysaccharide transporter